MREAAAALRKSYKMPNLSYEVKSNENINDILQVEIRDNLCRRFMAKGIKNVKIGPSPSWMQERLIDAGIRPINNIVDITNFVMLEVGENQCMPMMQGKYQVRKLLWGRAKNNEKFTTLDGVERELDETYLCIKDGETTIGLAGLMGGLNSEIKDDTTDVIFEAANPDGTNIRVNSKKLNLRTEASSRFEKDIDSNLAAIAIDRACALICELGCGEVMEGTIDVYPGKEGRRLNNSWFKMDKQILRRRIYQKKIWNTILI